MARSPSPENVTDLIAKPAPEFVPDPRYVSRYRDKIRKATKRGKSAHKTLGVPNVALNPPGEYLRKQSNVVPKRPEVHHKHYHKPGYQHKLPDWQPIKASEKDAQFSRSRVDFTKRNIDEAINLRPIKPRKYYVDDRHGTVHALKTSGLYPTYRNRKSYGQVPDKISPSMGRSDPKQRNRSASPRLEHRSKSKKYEDKRVKHETRSPRRHENNRDQRETRSPRKHEKNREKRETRSPRRHENNRDKHKSKVVRGTSEKRDSNNVKTARNTEKKHRNHETKDSTKSSQKRSDKNDKNREKQNEDEVQASNSEDEDEKKSTQKYEEEEEAEEDEDREVSKDSKSEIKSLRSSISRKSLSREERNDNLPSRGSVQQPRCRYVTEDERDELLYGMKKKWDEMMKKFQCLPFLTDTAPKAKRKAAMEKDLLQLEKDIQMIERHPYIYVYSDSED